MVLKKKNYESLIYDVIYFKMKKTYITLILLACLLKNIFIYSTDVNTKKNAEIILKNYPY